MFEFEVKFCDRIRQIRRWGIAIGSVSLVEYSLRFQKPSVTVSLSLWIRIGSLLLLQHHVCCHVAPD